MFHLEFGELSRSLLLGLPVQLDAGRDGDLAASAVRATFASKLCRHTARGPGIAYRWSSMGSVWSTHF